MIGIDVDVAKHIFEKPGVDYEFKILPWKRCWYMLQEGEGDVGMAVSYQPERALSVYYPKYAVWDAQFVAFTHKDTKAKLTIQSLDDIKNNNLKVGIVNGDSYYPGFWQVFPSPDAASGKYHPQLEAVTRAEQNFKKLAAKRIDVFLIPDTIGLYMINNLGLSDQITSHDHVLFSKPYPNVFSKKSSFKNDRYADIVTLMEAYDQELSSFKATPEYQAIFRKYLEK